MDWLIVPPAARPEESLATPAHIESLVPVEINTGDSGLWMVTHVNSEGRVVDYQVVSGNESPAVKSQLDRLMYFSVFHPATRSGRRSGGCGRAG